MMNIQVNAPFQVNEQLQQLIEEKVNKLSKYFERITTAQVFLKNVENRRQHSVDTSKVVEVRLEVPGNSLYADASAESYEKALAEAAEKVGRQLRRYKQQMSDF